MGDQRFMPLYGMMKREGLEAIAFVPGANFQRIFGRDFHLMERPLIIIVPADGEPAAIVPALEMASFRPLEFPGPVFDWRDEDGYAAAFDKAATALPQLAGANSFGLEAQRMRAFEQMELQRVFPRARFVDAHGAISSIRLCKTADEIAKLKEAIRISETALEATLGEVREGLTEREVEAILVRQLFAHGAHGLAFEPIVAAGDNSAQPHAQARDDYRIKRGDALLFDFGASYQGYNADITRTFFVGEVSEHDRAFYDTVLAANERGKEATRAGVSANDVDDAVQKVLEGSQFAAFIRHKTGHGLGLDVHEAPQIMRGNHVKLEAGTVFTVEPGLYRQDECGVRIEDDVVVTEDGMECLTTFPRELRIVG
ncbi:M24 family metallopeptidase [Salaquimonas pukyongi]|uniref:M24 family metallopeptidase n=1 Tax=Salaquimonas pukyongi TaxID=2712698 RepID=UPI00096B8D6A|nr:Xaa-Pro peptidase family protein [Salaquimonas pukyongi]